jgi:hypothetical protein
MKKIQNSIPVFMGKFFTPDYLKISFLAIVFSFTGQTCFGQITDLSPAALKAQTRQSQKEAARFEADYKDSHLAIENFNFRRGEAGRKQVRVEEEPAEYVFDKEINTIYEIPREADQKARTRKSKKENK